MAVVLGESGGVGCSSELIDCSFSGLLCARLSGIATCHGDSCHFPIMVDVCVLDQLGGPSLLTNGLSSVSGCLGNGVIQMGKTHGGCDDEATGGEGLVLGESSFHFPVTGRTWTLFHSGGVGLLTSGSSSVKGFLGNKGVVRLGVIEMIRGNSDEGAVGGDACGSGRSCNDDAIWGVDCGVILGKGGISHGRGMRSSEEGAVRLTGGNGMLSVH